MAKLAPAAAFAACSEAFAAAAAPAAVDISRRSCSTRRCRAAASSRRAASCHLRTPRCTHVCVSVVGIIHKWTLSPLDRDSGTQLIVHNM